MKRFVQLCIAGVLAFAASFFGAAIAQAQPIDCSATTLDVTYERGIRFDTILPSVERIKAIYPVADVYVQAYEQLPGGTAEAFVEQSRQCNNWYVQGDETPRYNVLVVAYGRNNDELSILRGDAYSLTMTTDQRNGSLRGVRTGLGPDTTQVDPNFITAAFYQVLSDTRYFMESSRVYFHDDVYSPPADVGVIGHEDTDPSEVARMILGVAAGFAIAWLVLRFVEPPITRYFKNALAEPPTS